MTLSRRRRAETLAATLNIESWLQIGDGLGFGNVAGGG
jgi:hypothetical protein